MQGTRELGWPEDELRRNWAPESWGGGPRAGLSFDTPGPPGPLGSSPESSSPGSPGLSLLSELSFPLRPCGPGAAPRPVSLPADKWALSPSQAAVIRKTQCNYPCTEPAQLILGSLPKQTLCFMRMGHFSAKVEMLDLLLHRNGWGGSTPQDPGSGSQNLQEGGFFILKIFLQKLFTCSEKLETHTDRSTKIHFSEFGRGSTGPFGPYSNFIKLRCVFGQGALNFEW